MQGKNSGAKAPIRVVRNGPTRAVALAAVALAWAPGAGAGAADSVTEVPLATTEVGESLNELRQQVAALVDGGFAVVWSEGDSPRRDVRMQWLAADGRPLFGPGGRPVSTRKGRDELSEVIVAAPEGGAFVAYTVNRKVHAQRFDATGARMWPARGVVAVAAPASEIHAEPYLVANDDGGVYVCFSLFGNRQGIRCQHLDREGRRVWGPDGRFAGGAPGLRFLPRAVADDNGGVMVFWGNLRPASGGKKQPMLMEGQRFAPDGRRLWGDQGLVVRKTNFKGSGYGMSIFDVVPDGNGGAVVVFDDRLRGDQANSDVGAQRVTADGTLLWDRVARVAARRQSHQHEETIASGDGGVWVIARENLENRSKLRLFRLAPDGRRIGPVRGLLLSAKSNRGLNYFASGGILDGVVWLAWTEQAEPFTVTMDVKLARYDLAGERLDPPDGVTVSGAEDGQFLKRLALSPVDGTALAVWDDRRKGKSEDLDVYGARIERSPD